MPKAASGYNDVQATSFSEREKLAPGGYVLKILDIREESYQWGDVIVLCFDIAEGEQTGFFKRQFEAMSDEYKKWKGSYRLNIPTPNGSSEDEQKKYKRRLRWFKSQINAFEQSNNGLTIDCSRDWDAAVLKGKTVGAVFGNQEFYNKNNGQSYWFTGLDHLIPADDVRQGNFKIPADKEDRNKPKDDSLSRLAQIGGALSDFEEIATNAPLPF